MEDFSERLSNIITRALADKLKYRSSTPAEAMYESIEHYTRITGKRFRKTKAQVKRGLSREEAFQEFLENKAKEDA